MKKLLSLAVAMVLVVAAAFADESPRLNAPTLEYRAISGYALDRAPSNTFSFQDEPVETVWSAEVFAAWKQVYAAASRKLGVLEKPFGQDWLTCDVLAWVGAEVSTGAIAGGGALSKSFAIAGNVDGWAGPGVLIANGKAANVGLFAGIRAKLRS